MRSFPLSILVALAALTAGVGCSSNALDTDPTLFVTATTKNPTANVTQSAAGTGVTGGFTISLHLGLRAASSANVNLQGFQVTTKDKTTIVIDSVPLKPINTTFPITLEPGDDEDVPLEVDLGSSLFSKDVGTKLCNFSDMIYTGSLTDSLRDGVVPLDTAVITVTGCGP